MRDKAIITSALPYANGEIHLGHVASTYLPADVTTRFLRMKGVEAYYICASDDFGTPILIQSEKEGKTPAEYVAHWNRRDREDFEALGVSFDHFGSTSSRRAVEFARRAFDELLAAGHIYEADVVQPYCEADSMFLPDRYVRGTCPTCGAEDQYSDLCEACGRIPDAVESPRCAMCGAAPVERSSRHYFFRLGGFAGELADWLEGCSSLQPDVKRYVLNWIRDGLADWDITRDMSWGVPVPGGEGEGGAGDGPPRKVLYGWFDNHLSYISAAAEFLEGRGIDAERFWNGADVYHFIGKDIVYHHYLFLPAMRMGLGRRYKLPDYMPTRGHLTLGSRKISKSRGWYIGLREFLEEYPADYLRFYLLLISPYSQDDLNFDWADFAARINSDLIGNVGNLVNRAVGFACRRHEGRVPRARRVGGGRQGGGPAHIGAARPGGPAARREPPGQGPQGRPGVLGRVQQVLSALRAVEGRARRGRLRVHVGQRGAQPLARAAPVRAVRRPGHVEAARARGRRRRARRAQVGRDGRDGPRAGACPRAGRAAVCKDRRGRGEEAR